MDREVVEDVVIARVAKARGVRGEVACDLETDFPERFASLERVTLVMPDGSRQALSIEHHWFHQHRVVLKFEGCDDRTSAEKLVGAWLVVPESDRAELAEGEFYQYDIIGAQAVTVEGVVLGRVTALLRTGGTDVLVVSGEGRREHLIPFADDICQEVDVKANRIVINPPPGLLDLGG